jgi:hypothetical protein
MMAATALQNRRLKPATLRIAHFLESFPTQGATYELSVREGMGSQSPVLTRQRLLG